jgi:hypothetical protein
MNAVQVQRWLGHHSAAFTLSTYVHLLHENLGVALSLDEELAEAGATLGATSPAKAGQDGNALIPADLAMEREIASFSKTELAPGSSF